jgi:hypothetical protein
MILSTSITLYHPITKSAFGDFISLSFQLGELFGRASVCLTLIAVVLALAKPAPILSQPVPVRHRRSRFALRFSHVAPSHTIAAEDVKLG